MYLIFPNKLRFPLSPTMTACGLDALQEIEI